MGLQHSRAGAPRRAVLWFSQRPGAACNKVAVARIHFVYPKDEHRLMAFRRQSRRTVVQSRRKRSAIEELDSGTAGVEIGIAHRLVAEGHGQSHGVAPEG